ncbi:MAG: zinc ribbon domain-containing protein [Candidatus Limnocylindrales bacterium]
MFEELFGSLEGTFTDIVESDAFQAAIYVIAAYIVLIWLASAFWAYRDMRLRTSSAITPYVAALAIIVFTPIFFLFGLLLYRIIRPKETIAEVNERVLAEEAMLAEVASHAQCANCERPVHEDWIICPSCRNRLRRVCPNCEHLIELDWTLCAWCGKDFERAESPGTVAFMPSGRPMPIPAQRQNAPGPGPRMPAPRPPQNPQNRPATPPPSQSSDAPSSAPSSSGAAPTPPAQPQGASGPAPRSSSASSSSGPAADSASTTGI